MKKLSAFTIIEVVVTLAISSLITFIAWYAQSMLQRQFGRYQRDAMQLAKFRLLASALHHDADKADCIRDTVDDRHWIFSHADTAVYYTIEDSTISRSYWSEGVAFTDTFQLKGVVRQLYHLNDSLLLITAIQLSVDVNRTPVEITEEKQYSAGQIIDAQKYFQ